MSSGVIEYSVMGTAVRSPEADKTPGSRHGRHAHVANTSARPVMTELSVADYVKLVGAGIEPAGIVGYSAVFWATYAFGRGFGMVLTQPAMSAPRENFELREFTEALYAAREDTMHGLGSQALALNASGIVGVRIDHQIRRLGGDRPGLMITFHAIGTAIDASGSVQPAAPEPVVDLTE